VEQQRSSRRPEELLEQLAEAVESSKWSFYSSCSPFKSILQRACPVPTVHTQCKHYTPMHIHAKIEN